jgi:uncharacterized protein (DUF111 family)
MDITNFTKQQGQFLKADDVEKSPSKVFTIMEEATTVHNEKYDTDRLHIVGQIDKVDFVLDCSKTNARTIAEVLGADTKQWVGSQLVLETYKTKTSEGKMTTAINVKEAKKIA